jgi:hypothetical protein
MNLLWRSWRFRILALFVLCSTGCYIFRYALLEMIVDFLFEPTLVATFFMDDGSHVDLISVEPEIGLPPQFVAEVWIRQHKVYGPHRLGSQRQPLIEYDFRLLSLDGGKLVAIYEASRPHALLLIVDFRTEEICPCERQVGKL